MTQHKRQHFIPRSYLQAWVDETTPDKHTPYIWIFNKDGSDVRRKAPSNTFWERDMYTIINADGERDLVLEHGLAQLEGWFTEIREKKLEYRLPLDDVDRVRVCAFIATMTARTKLFQDHHKKQWDDVLERMERLKKWTETATSEEKMHTASLDSPSDNSLTYEAVSSLREKPLQNILPEVAHYLTPLLYKMDLAVFTTTDDIGLITSDHPCVWFDSEAYKRPPLYRAPGLMFESIEISLPTSPTQCILLNHKGITGYIAVNDLLVNEINRRTRFNAEKYIVVQKNAKRDIWFDKGKEPDDSWEKVHGLCFED